MKKDVLKLSAVMIMVTLVLAVAGCGESRSPYVGTYKSVETFAGKGNINLDLKEEGRGTWTLGDKTVEFTWVVNEGKIWIYTKTGAILIVSPSEGGKTLSADMSGEWHPGCPPTACVVFKRVEEGG
jgi:hypothetical protein